MSSTSLSVMLSLLFSSADSWSILTSENPVGKNTDIFPEVFQGKEEGCTGRIHFWKQEEVLDFVGVIWDKATGRVHPDPKSHISQNYSSTPLVKMQTPVETLTESFFIESEDSMFFVPFHVLLALHE